MEKQLFSEESIRLLKDAKARWRQKLKPVLDEMQKFWSFLGLMYRLICIARRENVIRRFASMLYRRVFNDIGRTQLFSINNDVKNAVHADETRQVLYLSYASIKLARYLTGILLLTAAIVATAIVLLFPHLIYNVTIKGGVIIVFSVLLSIYTIAAKRKDYVARRDTQMIVRRWSISDTTYICTNSSSWYYGDSTLILREANASRNPSAADGKDVLWPAIGLLALIAGVAKFITKRNRDKNHGMNVTVNNTNYFGTKPMDE